MVGKFAELALSETLGVSLVLSRHLNETQRASVAAKLANMQRGGDRPSKSDSNFDSANLPIRNEISQTQAADMMNVSERSLRTAKKVQEEAIPEITEKMSASEICLPWPCRSCSA